MVTKGEALNEYAQQIAKRHKEGKLEITASVQELQADLKKGNCPLCHNPVEEYTSKRGFTYVANPDHSPHTVRTTNDVVCVHNFDQFNEHSPKKKGATSYTGKPAGEPASSGFTPSNIPHLEDQLKNFDDIVSSAYIKLYEIASRGPGTTEKDKHITTMGLMHDFINYYISNQKD